MSMSTSPAVSVQALLTLLSRTSTDSITALNNPNTSNAQNLPLSTLRRDFLSILSVLYSNTTKLSIALNPTSPTYSAAVTPLKDLVAHSSTLASNASLFLPDVHGRTLTAEVHATAKSVLTALQELAHAHLSLLAKPALKDDDDDARSANDGYLAKTGVVHELIAQTKADEPQGLSRTNLIAVRKRWREHSDIIADAVSTLEIEAFPPDDDDDDDNDDGWDDPEFELDLGAGGKQSPEQIQLAKKILTVAERTSALFNDVRTALLPIARRAPAAQAPPPPPPNALLDDLLDSAPPLVAAVDNLATQIYGTSSENASHLNEARSEFLAP
ncbi:hypothetical protein BJV78DRAFT_1150657 [Lactifluus subvellereus]|nr:hypothetical protein BJV78DRAFT_1150657 [Lactifluus subvellereus]